MPLAVRRTRKKFPGLLHILLVLLKIKGTKLDRPAPRKLRPLGRVGFTITQIEKMCFKKEKQ
jgi:hypothetical protein